MKNPITPKIKTTRVHTLMSGSLRFSQSVYTHSDSTPLKIKPNSNGKMSIGDNFSPPLQSPRLDCLGWARLRLTILLFSVLVGLSRLLGVVLGFAACGRKSNRLSKTELKSSVPNGIARFYEDSSKFVGKPLDRVLRSEIEALAKSLLDLLRTLPNFSAEKYGLET